MIRIIKTKSNKIASLGFHFQVNVTRFPFPVQYLPEIQDYTPDTEDSGWSTYHP